MHKKLPLFSFGVCILFSISTLILSLIHPPIIRAAWADDAMIPFWQGNTMTNESMLPISYSGGTPEAPFLFTPINILTVKNYALTITYTQGTDWVNDNGKLKLPAGSRIPYLTDADPMLGRTPDPYKDATFFPNHQIAVTYTHAGTWHGPIPVYAGSALPNTLAKLSHQQPIKIVLYGDSIAVGANASGFFKIPPNLPIWGRLVTDTLQKTYHSTITFVNPSVGGMGAGWGVTNVRTLVTNQHPDLVIIAFGMNDGTIKVDANTFKIFLLGMINDVKAVNPQAEFILVSPTLANPNTTWSGTQATYKSVIQSITGPGIVMADMTGVHQELLKTKTFADMTGNNINHPNDFLVRWYAQEVAGLLIPPFGITPTPTPTIKLGDLNADGKVDIFDYNLLVRNFGKTGSNIAGDIDKNGKVDIFDYNEFVANFGK